MVVAPDIAGAMKAEIITLRAIALKPYRLAGQKTKDGRRDHNATSYSTETNQTIGNKEEESLAEIITLRAIALKHDCCS